MLLEPWTILAVGAALLGLIGGSFLNALLFRFGTGRSALHGRSRCMRCGHTLSALDLVPLLSFLFLRGRCRYCSTRISWQYPLVELAGAALSLGLYLQHLAPSAYALLFVIWMTYLFVVVYDLRHKIILLQCSVFLAALSFMLLFLNIQSGSGAWLSMPSLWQLLAGPLLAAPLLLLSFVSNGRWMGWGDGFLEIGLGWLLPITAGVTALMLAFWSGALLGIALLFLKKGFRMKSEIPFAPFLVLGTAVAYFLHVDFFSTITTLF